MTREEALSIMKRPIGRDWEVDWIDRFVKLGMLKLEPDPTEGEINSAINHDILYNNAKCAGSVRAALDLAGFKIVRK